MGQELAGTPALVDVPLGDGNVVMFSFKPFWPVAHRRGLRLPLQHASPRREPGRRLPRGGQRRSRPMTSHATAGSTEEIPRSRGGRPADLPRQGLLPGAVAPPGPGLREPGPVPRMTEPLRCCGTTSTSWTQGAWLGPATVSILPVDQGIEHSAGASFATNPHFFDPGIHRGAGHRGGGCNCVASTLGVLGGGWPGSTPTGSPSW